MPEEAGAVLVFDTGPLVHFARAQWLSALKAVAGKRLVVIPDAVAWELREGAENDSRLGAIVEADWIERRDLRTTEELSAFGRYAKRLVRGDRNLGEASVLALAETMPGTAVIDDAAGRKAAQDAGVPLRPTLALLCEAVRSELLSVRLVSAVADDLIATEYRLPFRQGDFERWARAQGLV